jgi:hypothetical protein
MKKSVWLVRASSASHAGCCVLGIGSTEQDAIEDAGGRLKRGQWAIQLSEEEAVEQSLPQWEGQIRMCAV